MQKLITGLHKFQTEVFSIQKDFFQNLVKGQHPEILFITCSDSRINPNLVTSAEPGELFIARNAGNIVPLYGVGGSEAATIEFAVNVLKVNHIILCGHTHCGALEAALNIQKIAHLPSLQTWISEHIEPTLQLVQKNYASESPEELMNILLQEHVLRQLENIKSHPVVAKGLLDQTITLHAWIYDLQHGDILSFNPQDGQFERIKHL